MDSHDQLKTSLSGHGSHEIHLCHKCGWPFPNPHPSARHRRAHKKVCGTIEGYNKLPVDSEGRTHLDVSDDEHHNHSDEDRRTPSPKSEKGSASGGIKDMTHTTSFGDDVFSDAAAEFSNSPAVENLSKGVTKSDKSMDKNSEAGLDAGQLLKVDSAADTSKPLDDPSESSQVCDPNAVETATITPAQLKETSTEELDIPPISKSEILMDSLKDGDVKGNGENDILDKDSTNMTKVPTSETVYQDASEAELQRLEYNDVKALDLVKVEDINHASLKPEVESVEQLKVDSVEVCDTVGEAEEKNEDFNYASLKPEVESVEQLKVDSVEVCDTVGEAEEKNEDFHVLSMANNFPVVDESEDLIEDFKDHHEVVKSTNLVMSLENDLPLKSETVENEGAPSDAANSVDTEVKVKEEEMNEDLHVLSMANDFPVVDQSEDLIEDFKDHHEAVKSSNLVMSLENDLSPESETVENEGTPSDAANSVDTKVKEKENIHMLSSEGTEFESEKEKCTTNIETKLEDAPLSQMSGLLPSVDGAPDSTLTKVELDTSDLGSMAAQTDSTSLKCPIDDDHVSHEVIIEAKSEIGATNDVSPVVEVSARNTDKFVCGEDEELKSLQEELGTASPKTTTTNGTSVEKQVCDDDKLLKQPSGTSAAVDLSVDSLSQTDSLDANWGSISVISVQSDAPVSSIAEALPSNGSQASSIPKLEDDESGKQKQQEDICDPPSFMTMVTESEGSKVEPIDSDINKKPNAEALKSGWIPSITNVVNESQGRKKNEEIIAKVTNWSATGMGKQQHTNLKNLLSEADSETKPKPPTLKQDENGNNNNNDNSSDTKKVNSVEGCEDLVVKKETVNKEWNSPARYPTDSIKKEKRKTKGKPIWVPFICCSSSN